MTHFGQSGTPQIQVLNQVPLIWPLIIESSSCEEGFLNATTQLEVVSEIQVWVKNLDL